MDDYEGVDRGREAEGGFNSLVESGLLTQARRDKIIAKMQ